MVDAATFRIFPKPPAAPTRAGALPAKLNIVEERTVGPGLGQDSIDAGKRAAYVGAGLVVVYMLITYGVFGVFANLALFVHIAFIFAGLVLLGSTLTLPGIAAIALTLGMAIDANVIIAERIREELRNGNSPQAAIAAGFERAWATILDSNVTTLIAAFMLFQFGSGPIKGFAVTLTIGLVASLFTAIYVTRTLFLFLLEKNMIKNLPMMHWIGETKIDFIGKAGVIGDSFRCQGDAVRPFCPDHAFAAEGVPNHLILKPGGVTAGDGEITQMEMIAMGVGKGGDGDIAFGRRRRGIRNLSDDLQQGQGLELQRVELGGIGFRGHGSYQKENGRTLQARPFSSKERQSARTGPRSVMTPAMARPPASSQAHTDSWSPSRCARTSARSPHRPPGPPCRSPPSSSPTGRRSVPRGS